MSRKMRRVGRGRDADEDDFAESYGRVSRCTTVV